MFNVILNGCFGRMGQELQNEIKVREDLSVVAGIDRNQQEVDFPVYQTLADVKETTDFVIDFSHESSVPELIEQCVQKNFLLL